MSDQDPGDNAEPFLQFLDDYFAECDEHLTQVRRNLLAIEKQLESASVDPALLADLFRSFHTIKGISAMVGLVAAEQLAHHMESFLRNLRRGDAQIQDDDIDLLIQGTNTLERVIEAFRNKENTPEIDPLVSRFRGATERTESSLDATHTPAQTMTLTPGSERSEGVAATGTRMIQFEFVSTAELAERGINVNAIRARLVEIGDIARATPRVREEGGIAFEFDVFTSADPAVFDIWREDNLTWRLIETGSTEHISRVDPNTTNESEVVSESSDRRNNAGSLPALAPSNFVRVDLARLDELMRMIGDLVSSRARLDEALKSLRNSVPAPEWRSLQETSRAIGQQVRNLREGVMRVRMVPIGETFERMTFVVRDLARDSGKNITLELIGKETEIDKLLVEKMMDPLLHLVRNAVSHGLESVDERVAAGKPPAGTLSLGAETEGEYVSITVADDGRGMDSIAVLERAVLRGLIARGTEIDDSILLDLICTPGFSTREVADRESGRGVGMDVVKSVVESIGGRLGLATTKGQGTKFTIRLPLTLAIADVLVANIAEHRFAVPLNVVREVIEIEKSSIRVLENNELVPYRGGVLSVVRLSNLFGLSDSSDDKLHAMVVGDAVGKIALAFDRIRGQRQIVVRGLSDPLVQVAGVGGATELGDDRVVLVLNVADLIELFRRSTQSAEIA